ncbi:MAG TPA: hypothetical protein VGO32_04885 [Candidatus Limnocylindria bacterium]|nr:hypothetical protein [Candidatus Limnocylindria bacterium]
MPDPSLDAALRAVAVTPQRHWRGRLVRFAGASPLVPVGLTLVAFAAVVTLGIGFTQVLPIPGTEATPTPGFTDTPTPPPTNRPSGSVVYTNEEDGYELTLPARWTPDDFFSNPPGTMRFGAAHSDGDPSGFGALTVSIGSTDGTVYDCAPSLCRPIVATTIDELDAAVENDSIVVETPMITTVDVDVTLDGEPARLEYVTFAGGLIEQGAQFHHLFAIHNGRPVVLSFDKYAYGLGQESNDIGWVEALIQGFRFLNRHEGPSPNPDDSDQTTWKTVELANAGFTVAIPSDWVVDAGDDPAVVTLRGTSGSVRVRAGDQSGHISMCLTLAPCQLVEARSMDDLIRVVRGEYRVHWLSEYNLTDERVIVDGVDAARVTLSPRGGISGPGTSRYLVFVRDERAVILEWRPTFSGTGLWNEIISGLRFID